jgi:hypothetical protein
MKINEFIIEMEFDIYKQEILYILYNLLVSLLKTANDIDIISIKYCGLMLMYLKSLQKSIQIFYEVK